MITSGTPRWFSSAQFLDHCLRTETRAFGWRQSRSQQTLDQGETGTASICRMGTLPHGMRSVRWGPLKDGKPRSKNGENRKSQNEGVRVF